MPSETWEHRLVFPRFSLPGSIINLKIDNWSASGRFAKTVIRFAEMVIRIICKNGDQICKNGDQNYPPKCHLQFSVIRFAVFSDQIHKAISFSSLLLLEKFEANCMKIYLSLEFGQALESLKKSHLVKQQP